MSRHVREVLWVATREVWRLRFSYVLCGGFMLGMSLFAAAAMDGAVSQGATGGEDWRDAFVMDWSFFVLTSHLATNFMSREYLASWSDSYSTKLAFLRTLPIPMGTLVTSRMVSMGFTLILTVPAFFVPVYVLAGLNLSSGAYVAFVTIWIGYALAWSGVNLFFEMTSHGKVYALISAGGVLALTVLLALLEWSLSPRVLSQMVDVAQDRGPLAAVIALAAGGTTFLLLGRATERLVRRREIRA